MAISYLFIHLRKVYMYDSIDRINVIIIFINRLTMSFEFSSIVKVFSVPVTVLSNVTMPTLTKITITIAKVTS